MTTEMDADEVKAHFGEILQRVAQQKETFILTMSGKPVAVLSPALEEPKKLDEAGLKALMEELREFRAKVAARGSVLKPGETWNQFAREGLD